MGIHGYLILLSEHRSTLFMDSKSHFLCKVTLSTDKETLCTIYSSN